MSQRLTTKATKVVYIPTRYALIKRMEMMLIKIDEFFDDAAEFGLSEQEADPGNILLGMRIGLIKALVQEGRIQPSKLAKLGGEKQ